MAKKPLGELDQSAGVSFAHRYSEFPDSVGDPLWDPIRCLALLEGPGLEEAIRMEAPEWLPSEINGRGMLWGRLVDLVDNVRPPSIVQRTARRLRTALAEVRRQLDLIPGESAQGLGSLRKPVDEALLPLGPLSRACNYDRELLENLSDEVGFLLSAYGVPLTIYKPGLLARTLEATFRKAGLSNLFPSQFGKQDGTGDTAKSDLSRILRRLQKRWTPEATQKEIEKRSQAWADHCADVWGGMPQDSYEED